MVIKYAKFDRRKKINLKLSKLAETGRDSANWATKLQATISNGQTARRCRTQENISKSILLKRMTIRLRNVYIIQNDQN